MLKNSLYEMCFVPVKQNSPGPALHVRYRGNALTLARAYAHRVHLAEEACLALEREDYERSLLFSKEGNELEKLIKEEYGLDVLAMVSLSFFDFLLSDVTILGKGRW